MRNSFFDYMTVERPSTTTSVGLSGFFVDFRLHDGQTDVQRPPTTASVGLSVFFVDFWLCDGQTDVQCPPTTVSVGLAQAHPKYTYTHHMYSNTLVYLEYYLKYLESKFLLHSMANVVNLTPITLHLLTYIFAIISVGFHKV